MFWNRVLEIMDTQMTCPESYGWFHLLFFALSIIAGVLLCRFGKKDERSVRRVVLVTAIVVILLEVYKLINFGFSYKEEVSFSFPWSSFPFQFCSTPMYVGLLAGLTRGRVHESLCAYLATFATFAGICVMVYPGDVFIGTVGINIQTMICHGSMLTIGIYLLGSGYVKAEHKTILKALPVFCTAVAIAMGLNEWAYRSGLTEEYYFNMFYFSPHTDPHLPLYSDVQNALGVANPLSFIIYVAGFTLAAYLVLLLAMGIRLLVCRGRKV
ncbi:MAG: YwaF family protein [Clostridia bacterium]|nr:YwaF family protein [Clostridia bacterium]